MNLIGELQKTTSPAAIAQIVDYVGGSQKRLAELINAFHEGPYRLTQRAAAPLNRIAERDPSLLNQHLRSLIDHAGRPDAPQAVKRNTMRLLQFVTIPGRLLGRVANLCFSFLSQSDEPIAVRVFSISVLANIALEHPEIRRELIFILQDMIPYGSPGIVSRANKVLKKITTRQV